MRFSISCDQIAMTGDRSAILWKNDRSSKDRGALDQKTKESQKDQMTKTQKK